MGMVKNSIGGALVVGVVLMVLVAACTAEPGVYAEERRQLAEQREVWRSRDIEDYPISAGADFDESVIDDEVGVMLVDFDTPGELPPLAADYLEIQARDLREPQFFDKVTREELDPDYRLTQLDVATYEMGPMRFNLARNGRRVEVGAGTRLYGQPCRRFIPESYRGKGIDAPNPCWIQVGLAPDLVRPSGSEPSRSPRGRRPPRSAGSSRKPSVPT